MTPDDVRVPGGYALALLELVARWGVGDDAMLARLELDRARLADPATRVPATTFATLVRRAHALTGEPGLAVYMGHQLRLSSHGFLGFAAMSASTAREALALLERFVSTRLPALGMQVHVAGREASLVLIEHVPFAELEEFVVMALCAGIPQMGEQVLGAPLTGRAEVTFAEPAYHARLAHLLVGPVAFGCPSNRLVFDAAVLDLPLAMADPVAAQLARAQLERELDQLGDGARGVGEVRRLLPRDDGGFRGLVEVARALHVSPRTLKRQLAAAGTSFTAVLDELRRERALLLLGDARQTLDAIAELLGYSDVANFTRAFRRWTGTTPAGYRRKRG